MDPNAKENGQPVPPKVVLPRQTGQPQQGAPGVGAARNVQTTHIDLPDLKSPGAPESPQSPTPAVAKATVVVMPAPAGPRSSERYQTMQIEPNDLMAGAGAPATASAPTQAPTPSPSPTVSVKPIGMPTVPGAPTSKRETSRIPLEMAKPPLGAPGRPMPPPTTIRVKPVVIRQTVDLAQAVPDVTDGAAPVPVLPPVSPESGKRKTSRISLESVLSAQPGVAASETAEIVPPDVDDEPRTIRIKRSAERPTTKTQGMAPAAAPVSLGQTARLELPAETPAVAPGEGVRQTPTRKKTIKVMRPGMEDGEEEGGPVAAAVARSEPVVRSTEDVPHATFGALAVLATLVMAVLIWVLMAQTFGRDVSLTRLSYGWPDCPASWPGQIPPNR